jgi:hypothetical protein
MNKLTHDADGIIIGVNYYKQLVDIQWTETSTGSYMIARDVVIPQDGDGIYRQTVQLGDRVRIAFRNSNRRYPYISMFYKESSSKQDYYTKSGAGIPKGLSL